MNIEKAINYLEENLKNWKADRPDLGNSDIVEEVDKDYKAIETLLTAYEKEKETSHYIQSQLDIANAKLVEEKEKNKKLSEHADNLLGEKEYYQDCYDGITFKINNLISQIESAIDFMKTDKSKIKVDMYKQKEEDLKLEIVHLKKILKEK